MAPDFEIAKDVAEKSATLLKNTGGALPLKNADFAGKGLLVMGPTATATYVGGGGSAHVTPFEPIINSLTALRARPAPARSTTSRGTTWTASSCPRPQRRFRPAGRTAGSAGRSRDAARLRSRARRVTGSCAPDLLDPTVDSNREPPRRHGLALDDALHGARRTRRVAGS